ncbi:GPW/gp25 family protein [Streptoalloteichus hindustanus]|uniref:IraD/Gp25-like domain-containing protein n=1 Tax=Streptoalloteichus hindustanus TaxID=2017 RepID=A0A1M5CM55_STRHI|nr:GPW/gp25 family protein [Streptoalloteichus hindustanus]SHF55790.1 hypothetical protein SAMN05444320_10485 [Streptoalloteichus hindustanus]
MEGDILGRGLAFPVRPGPGGGLRGAAGAEKVRQSILLVLSTRLGERQMRPDFGCGIHDLLFEPNTVLLHGVVAEKVRTALTLWEPRVDVLDVATEAPADTRDCLLVRVSYRLRSDNTTHNVVYPFFLSEGAATGVGGSAV